MTDNLEHLLANVDDLDDLLQESNVVADDQSEPENLEVSIESKDFPENVQESFDESESSGTVEPAETEQVATPGEASSEPPSSAKTPGVPGTEKVFSGPGTKEWNSGSPYVIAVNDTSLKKEAEQLSNIFYFVTATVADPSGSDIIKKALIDYMRKPDRDMLEKYKVFLYQELLKELLEINTVFLEKGRDEKELFYHIGPVTVEKTLMAKFKHEKRGYCFCYTGSGKGIRLFPEETIKTVIMNWFSENVFAARIDFDNITHYDRVKRKVNETYREDRKRFQMLLEKVNLRAGEGRSVTPARFLALKGNDIFGPVKLQVYRRFIGNNIFI